MKTAMIRSAGGGIGQTLVSRLREEDWRALAMGHLTSDLGNLKSHLLEADAADPGAVEQALIAARQKVNQVDLWSSAAGDIDASKVADSSPADWKRILEANLIGAHLVTLQPAASGP